jgi:hypothetical protein
MDLSAIDKKALRRAEAEGLGKLRVTAKKGSGKCMNVIAPSLPTEPR